MKTDKRKDLIAVGISAAVILFACALFIPWSNLFPPALTDKEILALQRGQIFSASGVSTSAILEELSLKVETGSDGRPFYVGVISPKLDEVLDVLVDAYNADPSTTKPIHLKEVRLSLTEDIVNATTKENEYSPFMHFVYWTYEPAELVWRYSGTDLNGIERTAGQPVEGTGLTNYTFSTNRKGNSNYQFAWE